MWSGSQMFGDNTEANDEFAKLTEARKHMAFDFCFQLYYPSTSDAVYRECIYEYSRYTRSA